MHPALCQALLQEQVEVANQSPVRSRLQQDVRREGTRVLAFAQGSDRLLLFEFDGPNYDAEPLRLRLRDADSGDELALESWPQGLGPAEHPVLHRPFTCLRGLYEYHCHPSHVTDPWDAYRFKYRLEDMLRILLDKAGI